MPRASDSRLQVPGSRFLTDPMPLKKDMEACLAYLAKNPTPEQFSFILDAFVRCSLGHLKSYNNSRPLASGSRQCILFSPSPHRHSSSFPIPDPPSVRRTPVLFAPALVPPLCLSAHLVRKLPFCMKRWRRKFISGKQFMGSGHHRLIFHFLCYRTKSSAHFPYYASTVAAQKSSHLPRHTS